MYFYLLKNTKQPLNNNSHTHQLKPKNKDKNKILNQIHKPHNQKTIMQTPDTLYYSNYCSHCNSLLEFLNKNGFIDKLSFINIDKRKQDEQGVLYALQHNGKWVLVPHIIHSVPALIVSKNHHLLLGEQIQAHFQSQIQTTTEMAGNGNGEPIEYSQTQMNLGKVEEGGTNRMLSANSSISGSAYI